MQETQDMWVQSLSQEDPLDLPVLQYSCLENSINRGDWWATVHRVTKNWTRWSVRAHTHALNLGTFMIKII